MGKLTELRVVIHTIHVFLVAFCCFLCMRTSVYAYMHRHTYIHVHVHVIRIASTVLTVLHVKICVCVYECIIMFVHTYIQRS